eukprot:270111-Prorocentrum_minimum.AAC.1
MPPTGAFGRIWGGRGGGAYAEVGRGAVAEGKLKGQLEVVRGRLDADVAEAGRLGALRPEEDALQGVTSNAKGRG